jgi:integrase/recombinase XerD
MVSLRLYATKDEYEKAMADKGSQTPKIKKLRDELLSSRTKAENVLQNLTSITKDSFNQYFLSEIDISTISKLTDMKSQFEAYILELHEEDRIRSSEWYASALKSFLSFRSNCDLHLIDKDYLKKYEVYMAKRGFSRSTTKMYLEAMRCIFNRAIKKKLLNSKHYPFRDFTIGRSAESKKVLYPHQVKQLWEHPTMNKAQQLAKDMWFISYLCNGANNLDLMRLKWKDVSNGTITFNRQKTKNTSKESKTVVIYLHDQLKELIEKHANKDRRPNGYVFPILNGLTTEADVVKRIRDWRRHVNRCLNRMGKRLGYDFLLSLSLARHSFATALKIKGTAVAMIGDCLGHTSTSTTEHYLKSIPDEMMRSISSSLLVFEKAG